MYFQNINKLAHLYCKIDVTLIQLKIEKKENNSNKIISNIEDMFI